MFAFLRPLGRLVLRDLLVAPRSLDRNLSAYVQSPHFWLLGPWGLLSFSPVSRISSDGRVDLEGPLSDRGVEFDEVLQDHDFLCRLCRCGAFHRAVV